MSKMLSADGVPTPFLDLFFQNKRRAFLKVTVEMRAKLLEEYSLVNELKDPTGDVWKKMRERFVFNHGYVTRDWAGEALFNDDLLKVDRGNGTYSLWKVGRKFGGTKGEVVHLVPPELEGKLGKL